MITRKILALIASGLVCIHSASAISADDLASWLGVGSWRTVVDLPAETFTVQVYEFANGVVADHPLIDGESQWSKTPEAGVLVLIGSQDGMYRIMVKFSSGCTLTVLSKTAIFGTTFSQDLPRLKAGDFFILGEPKGGDLLPDSKDIRTFSKGFLLRVKKL